MDKDLFSKLVESMEQNNNMRVAEMREKQLQSIAEAKEKMFWEILVGRSEFREGTYEDLENIKKNGVGSFVITAWTQLFDNPDPGNYSESDLLNYLNKE